eukprot:jgi/Ulvmu1/5859/UM025_0121.1
MDTMHDMQLSPRPGDGEVTTAFGIKSPAKQFAARYRGVMMRPMSTAVSKAQYEYKPFVSDAAEIDHNLYGKFLGLLKDAGVPWKARRLPESREDAMHIINAMVAAVNAYQYYQKDVERAYHEIEASMSANKTHTHNQAADVQKLQSEVAQLRRRLAGTENSFAKQENANKEQIAGLKSKLALTERDLIDSHIQFRKLERMLQEEKRHSDNLMSKILTADKPRYGKAPASGKRSLKDSGPPEAINPEPSGGSAGRQSGSMIPNVRQKPRSALPWEDYEDDVGHDQNELVNSAPTADTEEDGGPHSRPCTGEPFRLEPRSDSLHRLSPTPPGGTTGLAHVKVPIGRDRDDGYDAMRGNSRGQENHSVPTALQVRMPGTQPVHVDHGDITPDYSDSESDIGSDMSGEMSDEVPPTEAPTEIEVRKSKSRFKRLLGKLRMSRPTALTRSPAPTPPRARNVAVAAPLMQAAN